MTNNEESKRIIENISLDKKKLAELESKLGSTLHNKNRAIMRQYVGPGFCCTCDAPASKKVSYDVSDDDGEGKVVEKYCDKCFDRWVVNEDKDKVLLTATNGIDKTIALKGSISRGNDAL